MANNEYEVMLKSIRGEEFCDVIACSCVKAPFYKKASFWIIKINVSSLWASQLFNELTTKTLRKFRLIINESQKDPVTDKKKNIQLVHYKIYKCIHAISASHGYKISMEDTNAEIIMTLVDYMFYDLFTKKSFNRKFTNISAFDIITKEYEEKFLKTRFGDEVFNFNHVEVDSDGQKNDYIHDEILISSKNDLQVTDFLLYNKKAMMYPSFYFFDDFYLDSLDHPVDYPLTTHFVSLGNISDFEKFDISINPEILNNTTIVKEIPIDDVFQNLVQGYDSIIFKSNNMVSNLDKDSKSTLFHPKITKSESSTYEINEQRISNVSKVSIDDLSHGNTGKPDDDFETRQKHLSFYVQDSNELTIERLKNYRIFMEGKVKQFVIVQIINCFCDWMQFGRIYNFDGTSPSDYLYTPIAIENVFYRSTSETTTKHSLRVLMLQYNYNDSRPCDLCYFYNEDTGSCNLHLVAVDPESWCNDWSSDGINTPE